jgi:hypothetical protein
MKHILSHLTWIDPAQNLPGSILSVGRFPQAQDGTILLIPIDQVFSDSRGLPDKDRQDTRGTRVQRAGMTDFAAPQYATDFGHNIV